MWLARVERLVEGNLSSKLDDLSTQALREAG